MTRITTLAGNISIWVFTDHNPPHFHIKCAGRDASIDMRTLEVLIGEVDRRDFAAAMSWLSVSANYQMLVTEWDRLNEHD